MYATLPPEPSTSVFLNAHSGLSLDNITFVLKLDNKVVVETVSNKPFRLDNVESVGQRNVHSVLVTNLTAATLYHLEVVNPQGKILK